MIAVLVSILFLLASGLTPQAGVEARPDFRSAAEQEASAENDPEASLRLRSSRATRWRAAHNLFPARSARAEAGYFGYPAALKDLSFPLKIFPPDLYALKQAYRL
jgi:hypothetical protein